MSNITAEPKSQLPLLSPCIYIMAYHLGCQHAARKGGAYGHFSNIARKGGAYGHFPNNADNNADDIPTPTQLIH